MWTNAQLKENAKKSLSSHYFIALIATIIVMVLTGQGSSGSSGSSSMSDSLSNLFEYRFNDGDYDDSYYDDYDDSYNDDYDNSYDSGDFGDNEYYDDFFGYDYYEDFDSSDDVSKAFEDFFNEFSEEFGDVDRLGAYLAGGIAAVFIIVLIGVLVGIAYNIFFANPLEAGHCRFYLDARMGGANIGRIFSQFNGGMYMATVKNMFIMKLKLFLWGLLSVIPAFFAFAASFAELKKIDMAHSYSYSEVMAIAGPIVAIWLIAALVSCVLSIPQLVKKYEYFLVPYLTAENPSLGTKRTFELSKTLMKGEKMHVFGLQLSFIGWLMLAGIASGIVIMVPFIGFFLSIAAINAVYPYINATNAEFYCCMREKAMSTGISDSFELNGVFGSFNASYPQSSSSEPYQPYQSGDISRSGSYQSGYNPVNTTGSYPEQPASGNEFVAPDSSDTMPDISIDGDNATEQNDDYTGPEIK